jgi:hypothetical protein
VVSVCKVRYELIIAPAKPTTVSSCTAILEGAKFAFKKKI